MTAMAWAPPAPPTVPRLADRRGGGLRHGDADRGGTDGDVPLDLDAGEVRPDGEFAGDQAGNADIDRGGLGVGDGDADAGEFGVLAEKVGDAEGVLAGLGGEAGDARGDDDGERRTRSASSIAAVGPSRRTVTDSARQSGSSTRTTRSPETAGN